MLKKHGQLFLTLVTLFDTIVICFSWLAAFYIHFKTSFGPPPRQGIPEIEVYLFALIPVWIVFISSIRICGLYQPLRGKPLSTEFFKIFKVTFLAVVILAAITFFYRENYLKNFSISLF